MQPDWAAIERERPDLVIRSAARLGEGWTAETFLVNGALVFKFPKRAEDWEELDREVRFLARARPLLPVPVAEHLVQVRSSAGAPAGYAVYRYLRGDAVAAYGLSGRQAAALASGLATFLRALHGIEFDDGPGRPILPHDDEREVAQAYWRDAHDIVAPHLTDAERRRLDAVFERHLADANALPPATRVIHADLSADHILHRDGVVTGILDWGDVNRGDPDYDFHYLEASLGGDFVRELARAYGHSDVDRLSRKTYYFRVVDEVDTIVHGGGRALPGQQEAAWQRLRALLKSHSAGL